MTHKYKIGDLVRYKDEFRPGEGEIYEICGICNMQYFRKQEDGKIAFAESITYDISFPGDSNILAIMLGDYLLEPLEE